MLDELEIPDDQIEVLRDGSLQIRVATLILRGPHAGMIVAGVSGWSQTTFKSQTRNPVYTTIFNMVVLGLTAQIAGQVFVFVEGAGDARRLPLHIAEMREVDAAAEPLNEAGQIVVGPRAE